MPPYALRLKLSWAERSCLWADDPTTAAEFGYRVDLERLPLGGETCAEIVRLCERFTATYPAIGDPETDPCALMLGWETGADVFAPAVMRLVARLRAELGERFVVEHDFEPPPAFRVGWDRGWTALAAIVCVAMAAMLAAVAVWIGHPPAAYEPVRAGVLTLSFGELAILFVATATTYAFASFDKADVLVIDWRGVADRRLSRARVDWSEISDIAIVDGAIVLNVKGGAGRSIPPPANPLWVVVRFCARFAGPGEFKLKPPGLATDHGAILAALLRHGPFPA